MKALDKAEITLRNYTPKFEDQEQIRKLASYLEEIDARLEAVKWDQKQAKEITDMIDAGAIDISGLEKKDQCFFPTIRIHPNSQKYCYDYGRFLKVSVGWPAEKIRPVLPTCFDDNLKQDIADFAETRLQIHVDHDTATFIDRHTTISLPISMNKAEERKNVVTTFPVLDQIVDLPGMVEKLAKNHRNMDFWSIGSVWRSLPVPEDFNWQEKMRRYQRHDQLIEAISGAPRSEVYIWNWQLTTDAAKKIVQDLTDGKVGQHKDFVTQQRKIVDLYTKDCRSQHWDKVRDDRGFISMALVKKAIADEKHLVKMEKKHGVKRRLERGSQEKGECKICKKHITRSHWYNHIHSKTHMNKALKLN